ncbi:MAG: hypothetical protein GXO36_03250 [Chloroflexi bacterium]|nr:hypothetical protein [Chloroflexota bacterium]
MNASARVSRTTPLWALVGLGLTLGMLLVLTALAWPDRGVQAAPVQLTLTTIVPIESITDDQVNEVAKELFCPVCENIPLDTCATQACEQWREEIRVMLAAGWTKEQIKEDFALRFGDRVLNEPPPRGLHLLAYIVPPVAIAAGAFILWRSFRSWQSGEEAQEAAGAADLPLSAELDDAEVDDEYLRRLEDELD